MAASAGAASSSAPQPLRPAISARSRRAGRFSRPTVPGDQTVEHGTERVQGGSALLRPGDREGNSRTPPHRELLDPSLGGPREGERPDPLACGHDHFRGACVTARRHHAVARRQSLDDLELADRSIGQHRIGAGRHGRARSHLDQAALRPDRVVCAGAVAVGRGDGVAVDPRGRGRRHGRRCGRSHGRRPPERRARGTCSVAAAGSRANSCASAWSRSTRAAKPTRRTSCHGSLPECGVTPCSAPAGPPDRCAIWQQAPRSGKPWLSPDPRAGRRPAPGPALLTRASTGSTGPQPHGLDRGRGDARAQRLPGHVEADLGQAVHRRTECRRRWRAAGCGC